MSALVELVKYGAINTTKMTTHEFYVIMLISEAYTLQDNTTIEVQMIIAGELIVKSQYICSVQVDNNWYWDQHTQQYFITVPTLTILHPRLEGNEITDFPEITKSLCNSTQEKTDISRHPICPTDSDYDYILE